MKSLNVKVAIDVFLSAVAITLLLGILIVSGASCTGERLYSTSFTTGTRDLRNAGHFQRAFDCICDKLEAKGFNKGSRQEEHELLHAEYPY